MFEYVCEECGHVTEVLEKAGAKGPHPCEECGSGNTARAFSTFAAQVGASSDTRKCAECPSGGCPMNPNR